ncbi:hypothetical protein A6E27_24950 [Bacillus cereus]|nr:hypothetical protein A6E27_24950 [Bacillus cereus]
MKISKIKFMNFRVYYGEQEIEFSTDNEQNLTLCLAKNNAGKTTLAQSIIWCFYDQLNLKDPKEVLNKTVKYSMQVGEESKVSVTVELIHKGKKYIINREKIIVRTSFGYSDRPSQQTIMVYEDNNIKDVSNININEILPRSLSRFFIFDGERMLHIGSNDERHRGELTSDIRNILGLNVLEEAISHLGGKTNNAGVLLSLTRKFDNNNDEAMVAIQNNIESLNTEIINLENRVSKQKGVLKETEHNFRKLSKFLEENKQIRELQRERQTLEHTSKRLEEKKNQKQQGYKMKTSNALPLLLIENVFEKSIKYISGSSDLQEAIPDVTSNSISYMLEKGQCICGTEFEAGDNMYLKLEDSKRYYPPESIGTATKRYLDLVKNVAQTNTSTKEVLEEQYNDYLDLDNQLLQIGSKLDSISRSIHSSTEQEIKQAEERYNSLKNTKKDIEHKITSLKTIKELKEKELHAKEEELKEYSRKDKRNEQIQKYKDITRCILEELKKVYGIEEKTLREQLNKEVQKVYSIINRGKGKLEITKRYDFVIHTEINGKLIKDDSKGQGLSTVAAFAFVCGITKLVREKMKKQDEITFGNEPYPLIIDAPYSMMDVDYIEKVSKILPNYAEQLIILVKDDNFETARNIFEENNKIGKEYIIELEKDVDQIENQFKTIIHPKEKNKESRGINV